MQTAVFSIHADKIHNPYAYAKNTAVKFGGFSLKTFNRGVY